MNFINKWGIAFLCLLLTISATSCGTQEEPIQVVSKVVETQSQEASAPSVVSTDTTSLASAVSSKETVSKATESKTTESKVQSKAQSKPTVTKVKFYVADAPQDFSKNPNKYKICLHSKDEYARTVMVTPSKTVKNFRFFIHNYDKYVADGDFEIQEVLYTTASLSPSKPFIASILIPEFDSMYGVSYQDEKGKNHKFVFTESGKDGSVYLSAVNQN